MSLILQESSQLVVLTEMPVLLAEKSLLIHMEDGEVTEEVLSQVKTVPKSIDLLPMLQDGLLKISVQMDSVKDAWFKWLTVSESPNLLVFMLIAMVPLSQVFIYLSRND